MDSSFIVNSTLGEQSEIESNAIEMLAFFNDLFKGDIRIKIVATLSRREGAGLREIARSVGISHKNLQKHLEVLEEKGIVQAFPIGPLRNVYKLSPRYNYLRQFFK